MLEFMAQLLALAVLAVLGILGAYVLSTMNLFFTQVKEGTTKAIMKGDSFHRMLISSKEHHLNDPNESWYDPKLPEWEVIPHKETDRDHYESRSRLMRWLGLYWVGIWPIYTVHSYKLRWSEMRKSVVDGGYGVWTREDYTDFMYVVPFPYAEFLSEAETEEGVPVNVTFQQVVQTTNPYKALFGTENWIQQASGSSLRRARNYVGDSTYDDLLAEKQHAPTPAAGPLPGHSATSPKDDDFSFPIVQLTFRLPDDPDPTEDNKWTIGLRGRVGLTILSADLLSIELPAKTGEEVRSATMAAYLAEARYKAATRDGEAKAKVTRDIGTAEAEMIERKGAAEAKSLETRLAVITAAGNTGALVAQLDAMSKDSAGRTVIWANSPFLAKNGMTDVAEALDKLGVSPTELKELIQKLRESAKGGTA